MPAVVAGKTRTPTAASDIRRGNGSQSLKASAITIDAFIIFSAGTDLIRRRLLLSLHAWVSETGVEWRGGSETGNDIQS
jgi:hypothetical protein